MQNIIIYFNTFLDLIFNQFSPANRVELLRPTLCINRLGDAFTLASSSSPFDFGCFLASFLKDPSLLLSLFVWTWFAILVFNLLLVYPFKWFKSLVKRK